MKPISAARVGETVGDVVGSEVVGDAVGSEVVGAEVGLAVGADVVGNVVGAAVAWHEPVCSCTTGLTNWSRRMPFVAQSAS